MTVNLALAARVITEGFLPAKSALLQGPKEPAGGPVAPDRVRGMLLGLAIGDALGNTSEGLTAADREAHFGQILDYLPNARAAGRRNARAAVWSLYALLRKG